MSIFDGIEKARASGDANYIVPGRFLLRIDGIYQKKNRNNEEFVVAETVVLKQLEPGVRTDEVTKEEVACGHKVGENVSAMYMKKHDMFLPNIKQMIVGLTGCHPDEIVPNDCEAIIKDEGTPDSQPCAGWVAEMYAREIETKAGNPFIKRVWVRRVPFTELADELEKSTLDKYFPPESLKQLIELEKSLASE